MKVVVIRQSCHQVIDKPHRYHTLSFIDSISLTWIEIKSMKGKVKDLWGFINQMVAGLPANNYLYPHFFSISQNKLQFKQQQVWLWQQKAPGIWAQEPPVIFAHFPLFVRFCD